MIENLVGPNSLLQGGLLLIGIFIIYTFVRIISKGIFKSYYEAKNEHEKERKDGGR